MPDPVVRHAVVSQQITKEAVLKCYGACGSLHVERRLDALPFVRLQALLQVVDKLLLARPRLALIIAETGPDRRSLVLSRHIAGVERGAQM